MSKTLATVEATTANLLANKFDMIISKQNPSYNWLKNALLKLDKKNAETICNYIIAMSQEINITANTKRNLTANLCKFSKFFIDRKFTELTHEYIAIYLQSLRKPAEEDESEKWIGTYIYTIATLQKFYRWLYYPRVLPENRALPEQVSGLKKIRRKGLARYSPSDVWTIDEHNIYR